MNARAKRILRTSLFTALVMCTGGMLAPLSAQDITGNWILSVNLDAGSGDASFVFAVADGEITGTYAGAFGEADLTGTIDNNVVIFTFALEDGTEVTYSGTVDGDTMIGECDYGVGGAGTFEGSKQGE